MGVYARCFQICLLLILLLQTVWISSATSINNNASIINNSRPLQQHHQVLVSPRGRREDENRTATGWIVLRAKGGRAGGVGGANINHRPEKAKKNDAASYLFGSKVTILLPTLLLTFYFYFL